MRGQTEALLAKATENLLASRELVRSGHPEIAVSRSYYAMFYAAEAVLVEEGLEFSSHGAVHGAFGERFAKTDRLDPSCIATCLMPIAPDSRRTMMRLPTSAKRTPP